MMFILKAITREVVAISLFVRTIATVFLALGMGIAMAQTLSLSPDNKDVTASAGSTDFTVTTSLAESELTVTADWTEATNAAAWSARNGHTSAVFDNKMWVMGGTDGTNQSDVWQSTDGITWTQAKADAGWTSRWGHTSVIFNSKMWVIGGSAGSRQNDVWSSTDGITWTKVTTTGTLWSARYGHTSVVFDGKIWVIGGNESSFSRLNDVWSSIDGIAWTKVTTTGTIWSGREEHASVVFDNRMWVIGGTDSNRQNDLWSSTDGITWTEATDNAAWTKREGHTSVVFDNKMWVIGGTDSNRQNDLWNSTDGITWTEATDQAAWSSRSLHTSVVFDGKMWVIGGWDGTNRLADVYSSYGDWLDASLSGTTLTATYEANGIINVPRTGTVTISGGGLTETVTVTQEAAAPRLVLSPANRDVTAAIGSTDFTVDTNIPSGDLMITDDVGWLTVSLSGTTLTADYEANSMAAPRTGTVTVSGGEPTQTETVTVTQEAAMPSLALYPALNSVNAMAGNVFFIVTTNVPSGDISVDDDADWLTVSLSGNTLTATYEVNSIAAPRTGTVTVSGGGLTPTVTVTQEGATPTLALSPDNQDVTAAGGNTTFTVDTNIPSGDITVSDDADWLTVSLSGTTLTADYEPNSIAAPRTGTVTVSGGGLTPTVTVTQAAAAPTLGLGPANQGVTAEAGSTTFMVTTNIPSGDLTITDDADWLTIELTTELSGTTLTATYEANGVAGLRTGTVTVLGGGLTETVTVIQVTLGVVFELGSLTTQDVTAEAGSTTFMVTTNIPSGDFTINTDDDWLTVSLSGTSSPYTLTAAYDANSIAVPRTGTVNVSETATGGGLILTATVVQEGEDAELALSPATQNVSAEAGSTDFTVDTNIPSGDLTITDDADWLTVSLSGTTLTADYEPNSIAAPRTGTVTVSGGGLTPTVTVTQAAAAPTLGLGPANQGVTAEAGSTTFMVTTNIPSGDLTITNDADWLTIELTTERSGTTLTATYEANGVAGLRTGTVTVSGGGLTETVTVTQVALGVVFELGSLTTQDVTAEAGSTTFMVTTNIPSGDFTINTDDDWLTVSLSGTSSPYTLTAAYDANSIAVPRTGTVTVSETATGGGLILMATVVQEGEDAELALSPATQNVSAEAGSTNFTVDTNIPSGDLMITDDADWLTVSLSGTTLTADYEANSDTGPRTGTITISGGGLTETVTVTQAGAALNLALSPATQNVTAEAGTTDFTVTTNVPSGDLTITDDADWLTVSLNGTTLTADYEANSDTGPRTGTITISGGGLTETVTVTQAQAGVVFELSLSPAVQSVTAEAGSTDFTVTTNLPSDALTTTDDADWLTVSLSGTTLTADYEANSSISSRTGTVTVSGGGLTETVTVEQDGADAELSLSPDNQDVTAEAGSTDFTVTTNVPSGDLDITDDADWLTVSLSGTTLTADYEANGSTSPRTGTVTVSGGGLTQTVTVEQEGTPLGLEDEAALVVYPNPGSAQVTVDFGDMAQGEGKEWMLLDPSGRKVRSGAVARGEATLVIPTQGLLSGLYLFQVRGEGQKSYVSHRVVIRH